MPSEPRAPAEPTLEELSAYLDHELEAGDQARVAEHVAGCAACQGRLDGLRQTAYAIRGLPMETPPRAFTVPSGPQRQWRWAPVGWVGGVAAAMLVIVVGATQLHFPAAGGGGGGTAAAPAMQYTNRGAAAAQSAPHVGADQALTVASSTIVVDPRNSARSLAIGTDARAYPSSGVIHLQVSTKGLTVDEASSIRIFLVRGRTQGGYAVHLAPPAGEAFTSNYNAAYSIPQLGLPAPVAGDYLLQAQIQLSDGSALIAWLPLTITS